MKLKNLLISFSVIAIAFIAISAFIYVDMKFQYYNVETELFEYYNLDEEALGEVPNYFVALDSLTYPLIGTVKESYRLIIKVDNNLTF